MQNFALTRRRFLQLVGAATVSGAVGLGYGGLLEPAWVDVEQVTLSLPGLAEKLAGLRIAQISDIHLSRFNSARKLASAVTRVLGDPLAAFPMAGDCPPALGLL